MAASGGLDRTAVGSHALEECSGVCMVLAGGKGPGWALTLIGILPGNYDPSGGRGRQGLRQALLGRSALRVRLG